MENKYNKYLQYRKHYFALDHNFFCGCNNCERFKNLGFDEKTSKMITFGLEEAHVDGGDGGGPYSDFEKEALTSALDAMEYIKNNKVI